MLACWLRDGERGGPGLSKAAAAKASSLAWIGAGVGLVVLTIVALRFEHTREPGASEVALRSAPQGRTELLRADSSSSRQALPASASATADALHGFAVDDVGAPVSDYRVVAERAWFGANFDLAPPSGTTTFEVHAADGRFALTGLAAGEWDLRAEASDGCKSERTRVTLPGASEVGFLLVRRAFLSGRVLDPAGRGVAGARVVLPRPGLRLQPELETHTDGEGRFAAFAVPPGTLYLHATAEGWAPSAVLGIEVPPAERRDDLELVLRSAAALEGTALDADGRAASEREVHLTGPVVRKIESDARGRFVLEQLPAGRYELSLEPGDEELESPAIDPRTRRDHLREWLTRTIEVELVAGARERVVIGGTRPGGVRVHGRLLRSGRPWPGVSVRAGKVSSEAFSDDDGRYALETRVTGRLSFELTDPSGCYWTLERDVPASGAEVDFDLAVAPAEISGRVVAADGVTLEHAGVSLAPVEPGDGTCIGYLSLDDGGRFAFSSLRPGRYRLKAQEPYGKHAPVELDVEVGEVAPPELDLALPLAGRIAGTVRGADGKIRPMADVVAFDARAERQEVSARSANGAYAVEGLGPGTYRLLARTRDGVSALSAPIELAAGETVVLDLALSAGTHVRVHALDARGEPLEAFVSIADADGRELVWRLRVGTEATPILDVLVPPGDYRVQGRSHGRAAVEVPLRLVGQEHEDIALVFDR